MATTKDKLIEELSQMPVIELAGLIKDLEEKWGVSAAAPVAAVAAAGPVVAAEEQTEFNVHLLGIGTDKIAVIKEVRSITGLGLKEAKGLVDSAPKVIKEAVSKEEANKMKASLEKVGAKVELK